MTLSKKQVKYFLFDCQEFCTDPHIDNARSCVAFYCKQHTGWPVHVKIKIKMFDMKKVKVTERFHIMMRDIKQIYHNSFFRGTIWIYGPSVPSTVLFSLGLRPSENSTVEGTSEPIDSTSASQEWYICLIWGTYYHKFGQNVTIFTILCTKYR